jgi:uncharacterized protein (TIGR02271 family)
MTEITSAYDWSGRTLVDRDGEKIGKIDELYLDQQTDKPEWARVHTGLLGTKRSFVPLAGATPQGEDLKVPVSKDRVKDAPHVEPNAELSEQEEIQLFHHYGVDYTDQGSVTASDDASREASERSEGRDVSGPTTDDAMTRSEEEMRVGTERRERTRARLRKYVVTEHVQTTVPVSREEVRVEREPITEANVEAALDGPEISEEEHEVVLHEERPVVGKETVPKERVRMTKDTVTGEETVTGEVRKERVEADGTDVADRP